MAADHSCTCRRQPRLSFDGCPLSRDAKAILFCLPVFLSPFWALMLCTATLTSFCFLCFCSSFHWGVFNSPERRSLITPRLLEGAKSLSHAKWARPKWVVSGCSVLHTGIGPNPSPFSVLRGDPVPWPPASRATPSSQRWGRRWCGAARRSTAGWGSTSRRAGPRRRPGTSKGTACEHCRTSSAAWMDGGFIFQVFALQDCLSILGLCLRIAWAKLSYLDIDQTANAQ